jgi:arylsulfatase A-like enzyme
MPRPNIVMCLIDDLGWRDVGCYGSRFYETPEIDRLASLGVRCTDAYATSPLCTPSRASLLTGQYPARHGMTGLLHGSGGEGQCLPVSYAHHLGPDQVTIADALREAGYRTWHIGKWHLGDKGHWPEDHGFDVNIAGSHHGRQKNGYFSPWDLPNLENGPEGEELTDHLTDRAIELIEQESDRPFFLYMSHYAVHDPVEAKEDDIAHFREKAERMGLNEIDPFTVGEHYPQQAKSDRRIRRRVIQSDPAYAALVKNMDRNVGRLYRALEACGKAPNTLFVFSSDNGGLSSDGECPTCNFPLAEGKGWAHEGGVREPTLMVWPGRIEPGRLCRDPITLCDMYPTFLSAAGLPDRPQQHADGVDLTEMLTKRLALQREAIYFHHPHYSPQGDSPHGAIRAGDWKLIEHFEDGRLELFNLRDDQGEHRNMAARAPQTCRHLHAMLQHWRAETGALLPETKTS